MGLSRILSLRGKPAQVVPVKGLNSMRLLGWRRTGRACLSPAASKEVEHCFIWISRATPQSYGNVATGLTGVSRSRLPMRRHLALYGEKLRANMWMMENF